MEEKDIKMVQLSCKIDKLKIEDFIIEMSSLKDISILESKNIHEQKRFQSQNFLLIVYKSGKVVYHEYSLFKEVLRKFCVDFKEQAFEIAQNPKKYEEYEIIIGQDEVGKGEMFGPMITASVALAITQLDEVKKRGVRDSKIIKSKNIMKELSLYIEKEALAVSTSKLYCKRFNELFKEMKDESKNLNDLLAWQHANALKTMLSILKTKGLAGKRILVIIDEFSKIKTDLRIKNLLKPNISVIQSTKAEKLSVSVAAASITAKHQRNERIKKLEEEYGIELNNMSVRKLKKHPASEEFLKLSFIKD
jgi:ribonuclease HIII